MATTTTTTVTSKRPDDTYGKPLTIVHVPLFPEHEHEIRKAEAAKSRLENDGWRLIEETSYSLTYVLD